MPIPLLDPGGLGGQVVGQEVQAGVDNTSFISHIRVDIILWNHYNQFLVGHNFNFKFYRKSRFASPQGQNGPVSKENSKKL